jgi:pyruvate/2-oxoglutarate/acetoin dehydrogenase E1 component
VSTLVEHFNGLLRARLVARGRRAALIGQNVSTGSCLSGLTRGFDKVPGCAVLNTPNCENVLVGAGIGLMLGGVDGIVALKQQDFLLLGLDHLVNTLNALRHRAPEASLAVLSIAVDNGWEGPQSCLVDPDDFCSFARIPGYCVSNAADAALVAERHFFAPGAKLVTVSQRMFRKAVDPAAPVATLDAAGDWLRHREGQDATIVACGFAQPEAMALSDALATQGVRAGVLQRVNAAARDLRPALDAAAASGRLVVVDDSKAVNRASLHLVAAARRDLPGTRVIEIVRDAWNDELSAPTGDALAVEFDRVARELGAGDAG